MKLKLNNMKKFISLILLTLLLSACTTQYANIIAPKKSGKKSICPAYGEIGRYQHSAKYWERNREKEIK